MIENSEKKGYYSFMKLQYIAVLFFIFLVGFAPALFAQSSSEGVIPSSFNIGLSYTNYSAFYNSDVKGDISSNDSYIGINCSYFLGEKFTFFIAANFNFLFYMVNTLESDETPFGIRIGKSIFANISADGTIGIGYTFHFGPKSNLFVGAGIHSGLPHMRDSEDDMFLAFNLGVSGKFIYRFYNIFYIGADISYDFIAIAPANEGDTFQGIGIVPSIGFVYDF